MRLDSFLYTIESFREARALLKDDGIVVVQHTLGNGFLNIRMFDMLAEAFGENPYVKDPEQPKLPTFFNGPGVKKFIHNPQTAEVIKTSLATDDWPFFYLRGHAIPPEYRLALEAMALITLVCVMFVSQGKLRTVNGHFFFLGAAFLLIETISVTRFALLFGSTWVVNSIVFSAILFVVLIANLWMDRIRSFNIHLLYALLAAAVVVNFLFPIESLLGVSLDHATGGLDDTDGFADFLCRFYFCSFIQAHNQPRPGVRFQSARGGPGRLARVQFVDHRVSASLSHRARTLRLVLYRAASSVAKSGDRLHVNNVNRAG